jgi:hypothetical protein
MTMNACFKSSCSSVAATVILALGLAGCGAPEGSTAGGVARSSISSDELLTGAWSYVPSASCGSSQSGTVTGNDMSFRAGGYCSSGNGVPFRGFTFEQPVAVEAGGTYELTLTLSNFNGWLGFIPTQFTATIAGVTQTARATSASAVTLSFAIDSVPPGPSTITFNVRPPAAGVGPVNGGIYLTEEGCDVQLSLVRTN